MTHPLADAMYDHDDIQGQAQARQEQDELNQQQPIPTPIPKDTVEEVLSQLEADILQIVGDEFAPKQENGSPERKRLLGLISETYKAKAEAAAKIERMLVEARVEELERWKSLAAYEKIHEELDHPANTAYRANPLHRRFPSEKACIMCGFSPMMAVKEIEERIAALQPTQPEEERKDV